MRIIGELTSNLGFYMSIKDSFSSSSYTVFTSFMKQFTVFGIHVQGCHVNEMAVQTGVIYLNERDAKMS